MRINDTHCHFLSRPFFEALARERKDLSGRDAAGAVTGALRWQTPGTPSELSDRWVEELDRHGVSRAAIIASVPGDEDSVAAAVARHPRRFVGFFMLNPTSENAPRRVVRSLAELGLRGVCLFPAMHRYTLDQAIVREVFEAIAARPGAVVFVHCGVLSIGARKKLELPSRFDLRLGDPLALVLLASEYPKVPIIIPHFGAGFFREALIAVDAAPNIYLDTSSSNAWMRYMPGLTLAGVFRQALAVAGPDRLIFGTDSSFFPRGWQRPVWEAQQAALDEIGADETTQAKIFAENFDRLFPL